MLSLALKLLEPAVGSQLEDFWGIDDEGELRGAFKPMKRKYSMQAANRLFRRLTQHEQKKAFGSQGGEHHGQGSDLGSWHYKFRRMCWEFHCNNSRTISCRQRR